MGLCGMPEAELQFDNVEIDEKWLLAPPSGLKHSFADLMNAYNSQRVGAAAVALGTAAGALEHAKKYLLERQQFGRPLAEFQGLQWMLADMDTQVHAARLLVHEAAKSRGPGGSRYPDMTTAAPRKSCLHRKWPSKWSTTPCRCFGARGYSDKEPLERMYRDVRMFTIGGGTTQILRTQIAGNILGIKTPQTRDGYTRISDAVRLAAE